MALSVLIRILLRVAAGFLIARGLPQDLISVLYEPELMLAVETAVGLLLWGAVEWAYALAKKFGWAT